MRQRAERAVCQNGNKIFQESASENPNRNTIEQQGKQQRYHVCQLRVKQKQQQLVYESLLKEQKCKNHNLFC